MSVEDDLSGLSEQEIEALKLNDDGSEPEVETEGDTTEAEPEVDEVSEADPEPEADPTEHETVADAEPEAEPEPEPEAPESKDDSVVFIPQFQAEGVENFKERISALDTEYDQKAAELATKYENGEMSFSEYRKEERNLSRTYEDVRYELQERNLKAEIAAEHSRQSAAQKWDVEQNLFYADNPDYKADPILRGALSAQLELMYADEKNAGKSGLWFLREAGKAIDEKFNRSVPVQATKQNVTKLREAEDTLAKRKARHPEIPKTLADVPAAEANDDGGNEFAYLDKLSGTDYEQALARLTDRDRERYMAA